MAHEQLKSFVERIERLESDKAETASDIRDVYGEAKGNGFDVKALRAIIRMRKQDAKERAEHQAVVDTYMVALGMLSDTPLGRSAVERATARPKIDQVDIEEANAEKAHAKRVADKYIARDGSAPRSRNGKRMADSQPAS